MFNEEDIYSRLLAGENVDDIAKEITDMLNAAQAKFAEEAARKAEEEAKAAAEKEAKEARNRAKMDAAADLVSDALAFCATYYPSFGLTLDDNVSDEEIKALASMIIMLLDLEAARPVKRSFKIKNCKLPAGLELNTDEVFAEAFKMLGI
jgi:hypothetical protein